MDLGKLGARRKYASTCYWRRYGSLLGTPDVCPSVTGAYNHFSTHVCGKADSVMCTGRPKGPATDAEDYKSYSSAILLASLGPNSESQCSAGKLGISSSADP